MHFPSLIDWNQQGTAHPWQVHELTLHPLVYKGCARLTQREFASMLASGALGEPDRTRLHVVMLLHDALAWQLQEGISIHRVVAACISLRRFVDYVDRKNRPLSKESAFTCYRAWVSDMAERFAASNPSSSRAQDSADVPISQASIYRNAMLTGSVLRCALGMPIEPPVTLLSATADEVDVRELRARRVAARSGSKVWSVKVRGGDE